MTDESISAEIRNYFSFLLDRGFQIQSINRYPQYGNWTAILQSQNCFINLTCDQDELLLSLGSNPENNKQRWFHINTIIYYISKKQTVLESHDDKPKERQKQFQRLANIMSAHLDDVLSIFGADFEKHEDNLLQARKELIEIYHKLRHAKRKSF